jgi:uncharacterized protein YdhG (YjbR/CyaY superfamily)
MTAADVDRYLDACRPDQKQALTFLRHEIRSLLPDHIECLSYAMPGFREPGNGGKMVVGYAAFAKHLGIYPHSGSVIPNLLPLCTGFKTSKSGVLFTPENPLPNELLTAIIRARQAELSLGYPRRAR